VNAPRRRLGYHGFQPQGNAMTDTSNPYAAPAARLADADVAFHEVAGRGTRLGAAFIDGLTVGIAYVPMLIVLPSMMSQRQPDQALVFPMMGIMFVLLLALGAWNCVLLHRNGQTLGKKVLGIKVVRSDGSRIGLGRIFGLRFLPITLLGMVPILGPLLTLTDALFIFGEERRCLHDRIADTIVVTA
jgi:uncharacterized RDD family membrane protein YckC